MNPNLESFEDRWSRPRCERESSRAWWLVLTAAALGLLVIFNSGCKTTPSTPEKKAARVAVVAKLAAFDGAKFWLIEHPDDRKYFVASVAALDVLLQSETVTPESFAAAMKDLPVRKLQGEQGMLIVGSAVILYDAFVAEYVNLDANVYLRPVIKAVRDGLAQAVQ